MTKEVIWNVKAGPLARPGVQSDTAPERANFPVANRADPVKGWRRKANRFGRTSLTIPRLRLPPPPIFRHLTRIWGVWDPWRINKNQDKTRFNMEDQDVFYATFCGISVVCGIAVYAVLRAVKPRWTTIGNLHSADVIVVDVSAREDQNNKAA